MLNTLKIYFLKQSLHPKWSLNSQCWDQKSHTPTNWASHSYAIYSFYLMYLSTSKGKRIGGGGGESQTIFLPGGISFISILAPSLRGGIFRLLPKSAICQRKDMYLGCSDIIWNTENKKDFSITKFKRFLLLKINLFTNPK